MRDARLRRRKWASNHTKPTKKQFPNNLPPLQGRAPPKQDVPGCAQYTGTQEYQPSFLAGYGGAAASQVPDEALATAPMTASSSAVAVATGIIASSSVVEAIGVETATAAATVGVGSGSAAPSSPLATAVLSSASPADLADPVVSSTTSALATAVAGNGTAGSAAGTGSRGNATATASGSAVPSSFDSGASEIGRAWAGSAGVLVAVGAVVAVVAL